MSELPAYTGPRLKLVLGKYRVLRVKRRPLGAQQFSIQLGSNLAVIDAPHNADVREGDLLALYTEVAIAVPKKETAQ